MIATPTSTESLSGLGNVPIEYRYEWKVATAQEPIVVSGGVFKWSHVHGEGVDVRVDVDAAARQVIIEGAPSWDLQYGLNIALLHQTATVAFLIVGVWRGHNELWTRGYVFDLATSGPFARVEVSGEDAPAACVWELGVICHERMAWHHYLFTERTDADKRAWLEDTYSGRV
ncbi:MAG: hypothetical protein WD628_05250 [Thermomicrobiales bacterium]